MNDLEGHIEGALSAWTAAMGRAIEHDAVETFRIVDGRLGALLEREDTAKAATPTLGAVDDSLGVPANLTLVRADVTGPDRALLTYGWDAVDGAQNYLIGHSFGNPYAPAFRPIAMVGGLEATIGATKPFVVQPGQPYTVAVYAVSAKGRAPVPAVLEVQVPEYVAQSPAAAAFPQPVAWAPGTVENDSLVVQVLVGGPGGKKAVGFVHAKTPEVADSGAATIIIDQATAQALSLPNKGAAPFRGVGGAADGYWTECDLEFPGNGYVAQDQVAAVLPSFGQCLVGFDFPESLGLVMCVDTKRGVLSYFKASDFWAPPTATAPASD